MEPTQTPSTYVFRMDHWDPKTLPAKRMAEYLARVADLLGHTGSVHFVKVRGGSHRQFLQVDEHARLPVYLRLLSTNTEEAAENMRLRTEINHMLIQDGASAYLKAEPGARIYQFPGRNTPISEEVTVHEAGTLDGTVVRVGGRSANDRQIPITLRGADGFFPCRARRDLAKRLANRLLDGEVRVSGTGRWLRSDGQWRLQMFDIQDFGDLGDEPSLADFVAGMRAVPGSGWNSAEDAQAELRKLRSD